MSGVTASEELVSEDTQEQFKGSQMSKAGKLAMELATEKKRLQQELDDLQVQYEEIKPTTPTGTVDWYVKWVSMFLAVSGVFLISSGLSMYGQLAYVISSTGWVYVGGVWNDRAILIGSAISGTAVAMNLVQTIAGQ
jgi:hypothetical protein